jgi:hypothetical protein
MTTPSRPNPVRVFEFEPTPAVAASRARTRFVPCPACQSDAPHYLFHKAGVRFVRCGSCEMVYVNPASDGGVNYFDVDGIRQFATERDRNLYKRSFGQLLTQIAADYERTAGPPLERTLLLGRFLRDFAELPEASRIGLDIAPIDDDAFRRLAVDSDVTWASKHVSKGPQVVILHELLEACGNAHAVVERLLAALPPDVHLVVTYTNVDSIPARLMRRYWPPYFDVKTAFFSTSNLMAMMARFGFVLRTQYALPLTQSVAYVADRLASASAAAKVVAATPVGALAVPVRAGNRVAVFTRRAAATAQEREKLSIVFPCFNEARSVAEVLDAVLAKPLKIEKELIIVESNSTDGTREIVRRYEGQPGVKVVLEDKPRGKGHAVRTGLKAVTGTIVLIQDADFEYDIEDYDALLEPLLQHKATFVLGSRSLGLDDWKVRRFARGAAKGMVLNVAQLLFARTYNLLYQQNVTDVNTMFKVFRAECLEGLNLESNGFELDIELACKLARNGNAPMEVPVNYVARGFDEGKKISFVRDSFPSYFAFFKHRFG